MWAFHFMATVFGYFFQKLGTFLHQSFGHPGVNFTNVLRAFFAPKAFCHKITNPNCKHIKAVQGTLV
jgi:hypothetical protein